MHPYFHTREEILSVSLMYVLLSIGLLKHIHLHVHTHMYTHLHTHTTGNMLYVILQVDFFTQCS